LARDPAKPIRQKRKALKGKREGVSGRGKEGVSQRKGKKELEAGGMGPMGKKER
jgi:hypothetical protein